MIKSNFDLTNIVCQFCRKSCKNANSLRNHERLCTTNPDRDIPPRLGKPGTNAYSKAKKLGLPAPTYMQDLKTRAKISAASKRSALNRDPTLYKLIGAKAAKTIAEKVKNDE